MVFLVSVSDKFHHFEDVIMEYKKRLGKDIELIQVAPSKNSQISRIIQDESDGIIDSIKKINQAYVILCDETGVSLSTKSFGELLERQKMQYKNIICIIGGAYGVDLQKINAHIHIKIALSEFIFPHAMAVLILLEQLYRVREIKKGTKYHHDSKK